MTIEKITASLKKGFIVDLTVKHNSGSLAYKDLVYESMDEVNAYFLADGEVVGFLKDSIEVHNIRVSAKKSK
jgi:hypothetical protein